MFFTLARFEDRVRIIKNGEHPAEPQADEAENEPTGENKDAKNYREARMTTKLKSDLERAVARVMYSAKHCGSGLCTMRFSSG
jgi:hypothetical protein